jgi:hypothetical protein
LDSLFEEGEKSARDRTIKPKKRSLWPATRAKGYTRGAMVNTQGKIFKHANEFRIWLNKPWSDVKKGRSGSNKHHHGLCLVRDMENNLRLHCAHCDRMVASKHGQHHASDKHYAEYEKKLREVEEERRRAEYPSAPDHVVITSSVANFSSAKADDSAKAYEVFVDAAVKELEQQRIAQDLADASLSTEQTKYKFEVLELAFRANMSMGQLQKFRPALDLKGPTTLGIGSAKDLPRLVGSALRSAQRMKMKWIMSQT